MSRKTKQRETLTVVPSVSPMQLTPMCVCLSSDKLGCTTCEGVGKNACSSVFEMDEDSIAKRKKLWHEMKAFGIPQRDVHITYFGVSVERYTTKTVSRGIKLTHAPTGLSVRAGNGDSGTNNLIRAATKLLEGLRKAKEMDW